MTLLMNYKFYTVKLGVRNDKSRISYLLAILFQ